METANTNEVSINMANLELIDSANKPSEALVADTVDGRHRRNGGIDAQHNGHDSHHQSNRPHGPRRPKQEAHSPTRRNKRDIDSGLTPKTEKDADENINDVEPLLVTNVNRKPPQAEFDDDEDDGSDIDRGQKGVDDGFFIDTRADDDDNVDKAHPTNTNGTRGNQPPSQEPPPNFPYAPGFNPNVIMDANGNPQVIPDINVYQQKKNLAQGMMDLALLSANANQLRYVLESYVRHPYYWFSLISITISLILQVVVGVGLILNSKYNVKNKEQICRADKVNNYTVIGIFLITVVNVFIAAFGVADAPPG